MKIINIHSTHGPNYWSVQHPQLIVMMLDLAALTPIHQQAVTGFCEKIVELIPSMATQGCFENRSSDFLLMKQSDSQMGQIIEGLAQELQKLAGMTSRFGQTSSTSQPGVYQIVFEYEEVNAGLYAAEAAVRLAKSISLGHKLGDLINELDLQVQTLSRIKRKQGLSLSTAAIVKEAEQRGIPWKRLDQDSLVMLGQGIHQQWIKNGLSSNTSALGVEIARNKQKTKALLAAAYIPVPASRIICDEGGLQKAIQEIGFPLVLKPVDGNHSQGLSLHIKHAKAATLALQRAKQESETVVVEKHVIGFRFRLLVINNRLVAATRLTPAALKGNGRSTIHQLIELENQAPGRGYARENYLTYIKIDDATLYLLQEKDLTLQSVLPLGEILYLKPTASLNSGGTASDVTDQVHPLNVELAERIARRMGLDICGIDVMAPSLNTPITENGGAVLAIQPAPDFRMHLASTEGQPRKVASAVLDMLFPHGKASIPTVAVVGRNEKTILTRLLAFIAQTAGYRTGIANADGIYLDHTKITPGNCTDAASAAYVLREPSVAFAILECDYTEILGAGLGFRQCDAGIITNLATDQVDTPEMYTPEQISRAISLVAETVKSTGFAILNADDKQIFALAKKLTCKVALFGLTNHSSIQNHCALGGIAAFLDNGYLIISNGLEQYQIAHVENTPLAFGNNAVCIVQQVLPAVLAAYVQHIDFQTIRLALHTFMPLTRTSPVLMNLCQFPQFQVLVDNAHNGKVY